MRVGAAADYDAEDFYKVDRVPGGFRVRHFPFKGATSPCCDGRVQVTDDDRAHSIPDSDPHGEAAALHRTYLAIERKHGRGLTGTGAER